MLRLSENGMAGSRRACCVGLSALLAVAEVAATASPASAQPNEVVQGATSWGQSTRAVTRPSVDPAFLRSESVQWTQWMDRDSDTGDFSGMMVREIVRWLCGPAEVTMVESTSLDQVVPHFDVEGLSRREALWKLASEYDVKLKWGGPQEPRTFMDVLEIDRQRGAMGVTTMTEVKQADYADYLRLKAEKQIHREQVQDGFVYYAVQTMRDVRPASGPAAMFLVAERYKARVP